MGGLPDGLEFDLETRSHRCSAKISLVEESMNHLVGGFKYFDFHPYLGEIPNLTNIFQMG